MVAAQYPMSELEPIANMFGKDKPRIQRAISSANTIGQATVVIGDIIPSSNNNPYDHTHARETGMVGLYRLKSGGQLSPRWWHTFSGEMNRA